MAGVVQNGDGTRLCPGWRRDLVLLLGDTTGDISFVPTTHNVTTSQRLRLSQSPQGHPQAAWQLLSTTEMIRALAVPKCCVSRTLGGCRYPASLDRASPTAGPSTRHRSDDRSNDQSVTTAMPEKGRSTSSSMAGLSQGLSAAAAGSRASRSRPRRKALALIALWPPATDCSHLRLLSFGFRGSFSVSPPAFNHPGLSLCHWSQLRDLMPLGQVVNQNCRPGGVS